MPLPERRRFVTRQRFHFPIESIVVDAALPRRYRRLPPVATDHRGGGGMRQSDFQHSLRFYVEARTPLPTRTPSDPTPAPPRQTTPMSSRIDASIVAPGCKATMPWAAGSAMWMALLTWLTGSTQK